MTNLTAPVPATRKFVAIKAQKIAGSQNFIMAAITLIFSFLAANNLQVVDLNQVETFWEAIKSGDLNLIIPIVVVNVINPVMKIISSGGFNWQAIKNSPNFWANVATTILAVTAILGLIIPEEALTGFLDAVIGKNASFVEIVIAFIIHLGNTLFHFFFDDDDDNIVVDAEVEEIVTVDKTKDKKIEAGASV